MAAQIRLRIIDGWLVAPDCDGARRGLRKQASRQRPLQLTLQLT
jgi:hypothetical protein